MIKERKAQAAGRPQRISVSAEVYGIHNRKESYVARQIPKSEEQRKRIIATVSHSFLFNSLDDHDLDTVINAFEERRFSPGEFVIKQGDQGDVLYLIEEGVLDCEKLLKPTDEKPTWLKFYNPGDSFGELALLYNAPRQASIIAKTACVLWALDRETFNHIVKEAAM
jgi:cAMP-dependent protein kinase regulator